MGAVMLGGRLPCCPRVMAWKVRGAWGPAPSLLPSLYSAEGVGCPFCAWLIEVTEKVTTA